MFEAQHIVMISLQKKRFLLSRSENPQGSYSKWPRLKVRVHFFQLFLLPFYFIASFFLIARHLGQCPSQSLGCLFWLVYHITPHMLHMITLRMKFSGGFMDDDFV